MIVEVFGRGRLSADGERVPVAIILTDADKRNIAAMAPGATIYCVYPDGLPAQQIKSWLDHLKQKHA